MLPRWFRSRNRRGPSVWKRPWQRGSGARRRAMTKVMRRPGLEVARHCGGKLHKHRQKSKSPGSMGSGALEEIPANVLLSQPVARQVPSAMKGLTTLFGMGRGVSLSPRSAEKTLRLGDGRPKASRGLGAAAKDRQLETAGASPRVQSLYEAIKKAAWDSLSIHSAKSK